MYRCASACVARTGYKPLGSWHRPASSLASSNLSEHSTRPRAVIVHDPTRWGALDDIADGNMDRARDHFLFQGIPDIHLYRDQLQQFHEELRNVVDQVHYLDELVDSDTCKSQYASNPNLVFCRDSAVTLPWAPHHYIPCNLAGPIRKKEPHIMSKALDSLGLSPLLTLPSHLILEGGDMMPLSYDDKRCLLIGYEPRTRLESIEYLAQRLIPQGWLDEILAVRLSPKRLNLDAGFCPIGENVVVANPETLLDVKKYNSMGVTDLGTTLPALFGAMGFSNVIPVEYMDSNLKLACNAFCLGGGNGIIMYNMSPHVAKAVSDAGVNVTMIAGSELVKGDGGPRCMTRPIY